MVITNLQIRKTLQLAPIILGLLALADLVLYFIPDFLGGLKINGYVTSLILLSLIAFYAYVGYPMFSMNLKKDRIIFRSHLALSTLFGKRLAVPRFNLLNLELDSSGFRDKLVVTYLNRHGKEAKQSFSITILSNRKKEMLKQAVEDFKRENSAQNLHLFI
jgi:hypothetical protein